MGGEKTSMSFPGELVQSELDTDFIPYSLNCKPPIHPILYTKF